MADQLMGLLWSRPNRLSLRTTWVTPATIALALAAAIFAGAGGIALGVAAVTTGKLVVLFAGITGVLVGIACGVLALYGIRQRLIASSRSG
jgi:hypothetical protein